MEVRTQDSVLVAEGLVCVKEDCVLHLRCLPVLVSSDPFVCGAGWFYPGLPLFIPDVPRTVLQDYSQISLTVAPNTLKGHLRLLCLHHFVAAQPVSLPTQFSSCPDRSHAALCLWSSDDSKHILRYSITISIHSLSSPSQSQVCGGQKPSLLFLLHTYTMPNSIPDKAPTFK